MSTIAVYRSMRGFLYLKHGFIGETGYYLLAIFAIPMYIAGALLINRTNLGDVKLLSSGYLNALRSLFKGFLLFIPLGLFNAADGLPDGNNAFITEWWMPITLPWFSGIVEEIWFRLLLVGLSYFLLRLAFKKQPAFAVIAAVLFGSIIFGLGHGRNLDRFLTTGLLYGLPMSVIFVRRDWEHAVGAHYMINMIPTLMVFLENPKL